MMDDEPTINKVIAIIVSILLTLLMLSSCACRKQITATRDSIYIERERIVTDTIVRFTPQSEEHSVTTADTISRLETSLAESEARYAGGILYHTIRNKIEPIELTIPIYTEREYRFVGQDISTTVVVEKEKPLKNWQKTLMAAGLLAIGYIIAKMINKCSGGQILGFIRKFFSFHV